MSFEEWWLNKAIVFVEARGYRAAAQAAWRKRQSIDAGICQRIGAEIASRGGPYDSLEADGANKAGVAIEREE